LNLFVVVENSEVVNEKLQGQADSLPRRKKKIVKDLRVTVTKLPVENNHVIDKIEKLEKMCAGDKTMRTNIEKTPKSEKMSIDKVMKTQIEKIDKPDTRSSDCLQRSERIVKNKQLKEEKETSANKSIKKDVDFMKIGKKDVESNKLMKKDNDIHNKIVKKDFVVTKSIKKDTDITNKVCKKESEVSKISKKDSSDIVKLKNNNSNKIIKNDPECKKKDLDNKLDLMKSSEVMLHKVMKNSEVVLHKAMKNEISVTPTTNTTGSSLTVMFIKKKVRRRKAINRTGFPTLKKKKKKNSLSVKLTKEELEKVISNKIENNLKTSTPEIKKSTIETKEMQEKEPIKKKLEITYTKEITNKDENIDNKKSDKILFEDEHITLEENAQVCSGQLRIRKDLVIECDGSKPCDKLCPVKYEKMYYL
jgi:histone-lysine N-methyltransferase ASH1L